MAFGLPAAGDRNWHIKLNDSINAVKATADAAAPASTAVTTDTAQTITGTKTLSSVPLMWAATGVELPSFNTRSAGTKLVLFPSVGSASADYAIGISSGTLWCSIPQGFSTHYFRWYGGTTEVANLSGVGDFSVIGNITSGGRAVLKDNSPGARLAFKQHNPSGTVTVALGTVDADIDATNLAVTFTAPPSGKIVFTATILGFIESDSTIYLSIRSGTTTVGQARVLSFPATGYGYQQVLTYKQEITGLTSGQQYTYKLGGSKTGTGAPSVGYGSAIPLPPATLEVTAG